MIPQASDKECTMQCAGYTKTLDLRHGDLVKLADARGTTLRVARGTLWVTQEHDRSDVVLNTGDVWTVERDGLTLAEAQTGVALCLVGPGAEPAHVRERRIGGGERLRGLFNRWVHA
jgi:hypothetical protein